MKARIKATGEYIEVQQRGPTFLDINEGSLYSVEELDLNVVDDMMSEQEKWYWNDKRIQIAGQIVSAIVSNYEFYAQGIAEECKRFGKSRPGVVAQMSIEITDALIDELKRKNDVYVEARKQAAINTAAVCENMTKIQKELQEKDVNNE